MLTIIIEGRIIGIVIFLSIVKLDAPSSFADSCISGLIACKPARKINIKNPIPSQLLTIIIEIKANFVSPSQDCAKKSKPNLSKKVFNAPVLGLRIKLKRKPTTTTAKSFGIKKITLKASLPFETELTSIAKNKDTANWKIKVSTRKITLCFNAPTNRVLNGCSLNKREKFSKPTNSSRTYPLKLNKLLAKASKIGYIAKMT